MTTTIQESAAPARAVQSSAIVPVSGLVDPDPKTDGHALVRVSGYRPSPADVYVSAAQIKQYGLRKGDRIEGTARPSAGGRAKYRPLASVDTVNGMPPELARARPHFDDLTPLYPEQRLRLEDGDPSDTARIIDLMAPIGKGQRGLIVSPPKAGKTMVLQAIAASIAASQPRGAADGGPGWRAARGGHRPAPLDPRRGRLLHLRPGPEDHIRVAELAIERAKRLVEAGGDVVVLLDSITRLGRAYNLAAPASSRTLAGGVAASALLPPRQFLGAARNIEGGGSLTILSTALVDTGSRMDDVLFEEFKGTGNMELRLRRELAEKRIYPAIDPLPSGTRRDELLMTVRRIPGRRPAPPRPRRSRPPAGPRAPAGQDPPDRLQRGVPQPDPARRPAADRQRRRVTAVPAPAPSRRSHFEAVP